MLKPRGLWWLFDLAFYLASLFVTSHTSMNFHFRKNHLLWPSLNLSPFLIKLGCINLGLLFSDVNGMDDEG